MLLSADSGNVQLELTQSKETRIFRNPSGSTTTTSSSIEAQGHKPTTPEKTKKVSRKVGGGDNDGKSGSTKLDNFSEQLDNHENSDYSEKPDNYFQKADNSSEKQDNFENLDLDGTENISESDLGSVLEVTEEMLKGSRGRLRKTKSGFDDFVVESSESDTAETNGNQDKKRNERRVTFSDELKVKLPDESNNVLALEDGDDSPVGKNDIQSVNNDVFDDILARETTVGEGCRSKKLENDVEEISGETMDSEVRVERNGFELERGEADVEYEISGKCKDNADSWKSSSVERVSEINKPIKKSKQNKQEKVVAGEILENGENSSCHESLGKANRKIRKTNRKKGVKVVDEENENKENEEGGEAKKNRRFSVEADILLSANRQTKELQLNSDIKETGQKICETPLPVYKVKVKSSENDSDEFQDTGKCGVIRWPKRQLRQKTSNSVKQSRLLDEFGSELQAEEGRKKETKCDKKKLKKQEKNQEGLKIVKDKFVDAEICEKDQVNEEDECSKNELRKVQKTKNKNKLRKNAKGKKAVIECENKEVENKRQGKHKRKRKKITKEKINQAIQSSGEDNKNGVSELKVDVKNDAIIQNVSVKQLSSNADRVKLVWERSHSAEEGEANVALEQDSTEISEKEGAEKGGNYVEDEPTGEVAEIAEERSDGISKQVNQEEDILVNKTRKILTPVYEVNENDLEQGDSEILNRNPPGKSRQKSLLLKEKETEGENESTLSERNSDDGLDSEKSEPERETKETSENNSEVPINYAGSKVVGKVDDDNEEVEIHGNVIHEEKQKNISEPNEIDERKKKKEVDSKHRSAKAFKVDSNEKNSEKNYSDAGKPLVCNKARKTRSMMRESPTPDEENYDNDVQDRNDEQSKGVISERRRASKVFSHSEEANLESIKTKSPEIDEETVQEENDGTQVDGKEDEETQKLSKRYSALDKQEKSKLGTRKRKLAELYGKDFDYNIQEENDDLEVDGEKEDQEQLNGKERVTKLGGDSERMERGKTCLSLRERKSPESVTKDIGAEIQVENNNTMFDIAQTVVKMSENKRKTPKVGKESDPTKQGKSNLRSRKRKSPDSDANNVDSHGIQDEVEYDGQNSDQIEEVINGKKRRTKVGSNLDEMEQKKSNLRSRKRKSPEPYKKNIDNDMHSNDDEIDGENGHQNMEESSKSDEEKSKKVPNDSEKFNLRSRNRKSQEGDIESQPDNSALDLDEVNDDHSEGGICKEEKTKISKKNDTKTRGKGNMRTRKRKSMEIQMEHNNDEIGDFDAEKKESKTGGYGKTSMKQKRGENTGKRKASKKDSEDDEIECEGVVEKVDEESKENVGKKTKARGKKRDLTKTEENDETEVDSMDRNKVRKSIKKLGGVADKKNVEKPVKKKRRTLHSMREVSTFMNSTSSKFQETLPINHTRNSTGMPANLSAFMKAFIVPKLKKK